MLVSPNKTEIAVSTSNARSSRTEPQNERELWLMSLIEIGEQLKPGHNQPVMSKLALDKLLSLYLELADLIGDQRFQQAHDSVLKTCKFRPDISDLYVAAGVPVNYPVQTEARQVLLEVFAAIRQFGSKLRPIRGKLINDGRDADGRVLHMDDRRYEPSTPPPALSERAEDAILALGFGDRTTGLETLASHPSVLRYNPQMEGLKKDWENDLWERKASEALVKRWTEAYLQASSGKGSRLDVVG